jgi:hypothetical protein
MKKLLTFALIFLPMTLLAQEVTADTPAQMDWFAEAMKILLASLATLLNYAILKGLPLLNSWLKQSMHFRGSEVVADALTQAIAEVGEEVKAALADGKITDEEKANIKKKASAIAEDKLKRLSGFYKGDLVKWIDEQLEVSLGKILLLAGLKTK